MVDLPRHISQDEAWRIIKMLNRTGLNHLDLTPYHLDDSFGYMVLLKNLPKTIDTLSVKFDMIKFYNFNSIYLYVLKRLQSIQIKHLYLVITKLDALEEHFCCSTYYAINHWLVSGINAILLSVGVKSFKLHMDSAPRFHNFYANCVKNCINLQVLDLNKCNNLTSEQTSHLLCVIRSLPQLNTLELGFRHLSVYSTLKDHESFSKKVPNVDEFIRELAYNQIKRVHISSMALNKRTTEQLFKILPTTQVQDLAVSFCRHTLIDKPLLDIIEVGLINSQVEHFRLRIVDINHGLMSSPTNLIDVAINLFAAAESLKTKALSMSWSQLPLNPYDELLQHLTHIYLCDDISLAQFERFLMHLAKSQIRSANFNIPLILPYMDALEQWLPQCKTVIEFGCSSLSHYMNTYSLCTDKFISALRQSNVRYLLINSVCFKNIAPRLRETNIIKVMVWQSIPYDTATDLVNTQITNVTLCSTFSILGGSVNESFINGDQFCLRMPSYNYPPRLWEVLHVNALKANEELFTNLNQIFCICLNNDVNVGWTVRSNCCEQFTTIMNLLHEIPGMRGQLAEWMHANIHDTKLMSIAKLENILIDEYTASIAQTCDLNESIALLKCFEARGNKMLSCSLLNHRPSFFLDDKDYILHPYVYILMHKYNMPLYQKDLDKGNRKQIIIDYFTDHYYAETEEIISLLTNYY